MYPRLKSSRKWVDFPNEYLEQISDVVKKNFADELNNHQVIVEGRIYAEEILMRVGLLEEGKLRQNNFEASISFNAKKQNVIDCISNALDAIGSMIDEFFHEDSKLPITWEECQFDGASVFLQYTTVNTKLEAEADRLLGLSSDSLVKEDTSEDALSYAETVKDEKILQDLANNKSSETISHSDCDCGHECTCNDDDSAESEEHTHNCHHKNKSGKIVH